MAKNITLAVDEHVVREVRRYAARNNTSLNAIVREALGKVAERSARSEKAWDALFRAADAEGAEVGEITWTRDELYER
jgi:hypothetical protein